MEFFVNTDSNSSNKPTLCLNMIVKNESKIIIRLLQSVINIIDCYCICDTGSTDNTEELIIDFFKQTNITGKIIHEPFVDFAYNRNFSLKSCLGMSDFILFLDADMKLIVGNLFNKEKLINYDSCTILQGNDSFFYQNMRIVRNNGLYNYIGVTHEYINSPPENKNILLDKNELFILDLGDGGSKSDKFERDIRLLVGALEKEPKNDRYTFYLANTYHDSGKFEKAIEIYQKRIEIGGWDQEVWYSYYRIGLCYKYMNKMPEAIYNWLNAYQIIPERLESIYEIIHHYRNISKHKLSFYFYKLAKEILNKNLKREHYLFLHNDIYTFKIDFEYTIIASYIGIHNINDDIVNVLNYSDNTSYNSNLLSNMKFYKDILTPLQIVKLDENIDINLNNKIIHLNSSSSSMIEKQNKDGYLLNVRFVNYHITESGQYINCESNIITANKYIEMDKNFIVLKKKCFDVIYDNKQYIGVEDVRIFKDVSSDNILFIGTGLHKNNTLGISQGIYDLTKDELVENEIKHSFEYTNCEKNWVYFDFNNETHIIYKWYPLQICKLNDNKTNIELVHTRNLPNIFSNVRGSTCGFKFNQTKFANHCENITFSFEETEIWFIGHIVSYEKPRCYYHIISVFDENMNLLRYSAPFKFEGEPIEYCLSLIVEDTKVLINYSTWDRTTRIGIYDKKYIDSLVKYTI